MKQLRRGCQEGGREWKNVLTDDCNSSFITIDSAILIPSPDWMGYSSSNFQHHVNMARISEPGFPLREHMLVLTNYIDYATRRFNTAFTRSLQQSLSWGESTQFLVSILISLRSILILPYHLSLGLLKISFLLKFWKYSYLLPFWLHGFILIFKT